MTASGGFWRSNARRNSPAPLLLRILLSGPLIAGAGTVHAAPATQVSLSAMTLDQALIALSRITGAEIISTEPGLRHVRTRAVAGRLTLRAALDRLLAGTGYRFVRTAGGGYRIVAGRAVATPHAHRRPSPAVPITEAPDVVVTGSKQRIALLRYPGTLTRVVGVPTLPTGEVVAASDLGRILPVIQSTQLGPGRNKVFVRGIADSSFNGTTLSTVSVYLDDVQLSASGPDPGLRLYDVRSVEVMEGPQGTLYGAGSIGGVIRLTSNPPDLAHPTAGASGGLSTTSAGAPGGDLAVMANVPVIQDRLAVRGVGYVTREGGYIDDRSRGANDVNRNDVAGFRFTAAWVPGNGWHVEAGGARQALRTRDGQYALAGQGSLARRTALPQPFAADFTLGRLVVEKTWASGLRFVSATGAAAYDTADVFDATAVTAPIPATLRADTSKLLLSHETRLSRSLPGGGSWLAGITLISDRSVLLRSAGALGREADVTGVRNVTRAASAFGEATVTLLHNLSVTAGARYTIARVDGEPSQVRRAEPFVRGQMTRRIDPTVALSYQIAPGLAAFARHQTGFRTGGLAVARGVGRVMNFQPDSIDVNEIGLRRLKRSPHDLGLSVSLSRSHWTDIQADLLGRRGQPYTANIGDATIRAVEAVIDWCPMAGLTLTGAGLYTDNRVTGPLADPSRRENRRLPETPAFGGYATIGYAWATTRRFAPRVDATLTYVGPSVLGTGDLLDTMQGGYVVAGASTSVTVGHQTVSLGVDNLANSHADRFAFGNPIGLADRDQRTPLRPRTVRLGIASSW